MLDIMDSVKIFLRDKQPTELKNEAVELIKVFATIDSDSVWFVLHQLQGSVFRKGERSNLFEDVSLLSSTTDHKMFIESSRILLDYISKMPTQVTQNKT